MMTEVMITVCNLGMADTQAALALTKYHKVDHGNPGRSLVAERGEVGCRLIEVELSNYRFQYYRLWRVQRLWRVY